MKYILDQMIDTEKINNLGNFCLQTSYQLCMTTVTGEIPIDDNGCVSIFNNSFSINSTALISDCFNSALQEFIENIIINLLTPLFKEKENDDNFNYFKEHIKHYYHLRNTDIYLENNYKTFNFVFYIYNN